MTSQASRPAVDNHDPEIQRLKADCAALRSALALLIAGLHSRTALGGVEDWRNGTMADYAASLAGEDGRGPLFAEAFGKIQRAVLAPKPGGA